MTIQRIFGILAAAAIAAQAAWAIDMRADSTTLNLSDLSVAVDEGAARVKIGIGVDTKAFSVGRDREIILTPVLIADDRSDSLALDPITIAGRNRWYYYLRNDFLEDPESNIYRAGKAARARYDAEFGLEPWMKHSTLEMRVANANCCDKPAVIPGPSPKGMVPMAAIDTERPVLSAPFRFAPPVDAGPVTKEIDGSAFVTFVVNRTELLQNYMNNRPELNKIINSIEYVRRDTDATITRVHIKGFASPEGPYDNNVRLAKGRTETLRRYVRDLYSFADTTVTKSFEPEDWGGLRTYVTDSMQFDIANRRGILEIIDGPLGLDEKNRSIQRLYPADYRVLLKEIYPWLRHSDYTVTYKIRVYTDINEIRRVYDADPSRLRPVDFYTLAQTYAEGSSEYCAVFEKAVEVYPDDPMLNLNAANIALQRGLLDDAQSCLLKAGNTPQANYARGILAVRRDDLREAVKRFEAADRQGLPQAAGAIEAVRRMEAYHPVTYRITPIRIKEANR